MFSKIFMLLISGFIGIQTSVLFSFNHGNITPKEDIKQEIRTKRQQIKVAFPTQEGMSFFGHSGKVTGYNYDYLEKISEYTGWEMQYIPYGSSNGNEAVSNALNDVKDGKADLLGPILKNTGTEKIFEFPSHSYGSVYTTLCALKTSDLREHNLYSQPLLKIGLWKTATTVIQRSYLMSNPKNLTMRSSNLKLPMNKNRLYSMERWM